jgi:hypothetical protein
MQRACVPPLVLLLSACSAETQDLQTVETVANTVAHHEVSKACDPFPVEWKKKFPLACELPSNLAGYSVVVAEDATIAAQTVNKAVAVGRDFGDTTSDGPAVVGGSDGAGASHVKGVTKGAWTFKTTLCDEGSADAIPFDWNRFKYIAANAQPSNYAMDENRVFVIEQGGVYDSTGTGKLTRYSMDDLLVDGKMLDPTDSGKTLVIFRDEGTVVLEAASNGQSFTPSVLAPKSHVVLDDSVGSIGGFVVARSLGDRGKSTGSLQLRGEGYAGAVLCPAEENECDPYPVEWDGSCDLPSNLDGYSIVVTDDAILGGTAINKAVAVGRDFGDPLSTATAVVGSSGGSDKSYLNGVTKGFWNFQTVICDQGDMKGGKGIPFDWERLTYVAEHATALNDGESRIFVVEQRGVYNESDWARHSYSMDDFLVDGNRLDSNDGGKTLVVFRDEGTIVLEAAKNGQKFGPSVLAPKAHVILDSSVGFVDGFIVARSLTHRGKPADLELRGNGFTGRVTCPDAHASTQEKDRISIVDAFKVSPANFAQYTDRTAYTHVATLTIAMLTMLAMLVMFTMMASSS